MKMTCKIQFYGCLNSLVLRKLSQNKYFLPAWLHGREKLLGQVHVGILKH